MSRATIEQIVEVFVGPRATEDDITFAHDLAQNFLDADEAANLAGEKAIVLLVSRRASRLYELLLELNLRVFDDSTVVSDRLLGHGSHDWSGRDVVVCDDSLIFGSTLAKTFLRVSDARGELSAAKSDDDIVGISTHVAAIDADRASTTVLDRLKIDTAGTKRYDEKEMEAFSTFVTEVSLRHGSPYLADFLMTRPFEFSDEQLGALLNRESWESYRIRLLGSRGETFDSYSLFPTSEQLRSFRARLHPSVRDLLGVVKIRAYRTHANGRDYLRLVPVAVPEPMRKWRVEQCVRTLADVTSGMTFDSSGWKTEALHRLIQLHLSSALLAEFWNELCEIDGNRCSLTIDDLSIDPLRHYFGDVLLDYLVHSFESTVEHHQTARHVPLADLPAQPQARPPSTMLSHGIVEQRLHDVVELGLFERPPESDLDGVVGDCSEGWASTVLDIFYVTSSMLEPPQEDMLREMSWTALAGYLVDPSDLGARVLDLGVTIEEVATVLERGDLGSTVDQRELRILVSLAMDVANDLGIAVPTTVWAGAEKDPVYRHFRIGENAWLAGGSPSELARMDHDLALKKAGPLVQRSLDSGGDFRSQHSRWRNKARDYNYEVFQIWQGTVSAVSIDRRVIATLTPQITGSRDEWIDPTVEEIELHVSDFPTDQQQFVGVGTAIRWIEMRGNGTRSEIFEVITSEETIDEIESS